MKLILIILNSILKILLFQQMINIKHLNEISFSTKSLKSSIHFTLNSISQFRLAPFQVFHSHT